MSKDPEGSKLQKGQKFPKVQKVKSRCPEGQQVKSCQISKGLNDQKVKRPKGPEGQKCQKVPKVKRLKSEKKYINISLHISISERQNGSW